MHDVAIYTDSENIVTHQIDNPTEEQKQDANYVFDTDELDVKPASFEVGERSALKVTADNSIESVSVERPLTKTDAFEYKESNDLEYLVSAGRFSEDELTKWGLEDYIKFL